MHINIWQRVGVPLAVLIAVVFLGAGSPLGAQSVATVARTSIDTTLTRAALDDLPSGGTVGGLLETTVPEIISDRIDGGGLSVGGAARLGARGSPWSQTAFQLGELDSDRRRRVGTLAPVSRPVDVRVAGPLHGNDDH